MFENNPSLQLTYDTVKRHGEEVALGWLIHVGQAVLKIPPQDLRRLNYVLEANGIRTLPEFAVNRNGDIAELGPFIRDWVGEKRLGYKNKANNSSTINEFLNVWMKPFAMNGTANWEVKTPLIVSRNFAQRNHQWRSGSSCWFSMNSRFHNRSMVSLGNEYGQGFWLAMISPERASNQDIVVDPVLVHNGVTYFPAGRAWCHPSKDGFIVFNAKAALNNLQESVKGLHKLSQAFAQWLSEKSGQEYYAIKRNNDGYHQRGGSMYVDGGHFYEITTVSKPENTAVKLEGPVYETVWQCPLTNERYPKEMWNLSADGFPVAVPNAANIVAAFHVSGQPWMEWIRDNIERVEEVQRSNVYRKWLDNIGPSKTLKDFNRTMAEGRSFNWKKDGSAFTSLMYHVGVKTHRSMTWPEQVFTAWHDEDWENLPNKDYEGSGRTITFNAFLYFLAHSGLWALGL